MSDYNEQTLMEAVLTRVAATPDPRLRQIMTSLVKHLHGFVREVRPTWEELLAGIQFLTAVARSVMTRGRSSFSCRTLWAFQWW